MQETCSICGKAISVEAAKDWDTYQSGAGSQDQQFVGLRCSQCNAVFCDNLHLKELNFKLLKGGYRSGTCPKCGASLQNSIVLLGTVQQQSTFGLDTSAQASGHLFGADTQADFDKQKKRLKTSLIISGVSTVWLFIAAILTGLIGALFPDLSESTTNVLIPIIVIPGLGFYGWPFVIFHFVRKKKAEKILASLPEPGRQRFEYVIAYYQKRGWNLLSRLNDEAEKVRLQEKKKFNIFAALFGILFGLVGFIFYLADYNRPGAIVELEQLPEGTVRVTAITGS